MHESAHAGTHDFGESEVSAPCGCVAPAETSRVASSGLPLIQSLLMANWRQIQGRIRRAKSGSDAPAKLAELYAKTRDAMVAFELGAVEEKAAHSDEAVRWYKTAIERFRRADWKKRAAEALERLGAPVPAGALTGEPAEVASEDAGNGDSHGFQPIVTHGITDPPAANHAAEDEPAVAPESQLLETQISGAAPIEGGASHKRRRRGRRGGRGRRKHREGAPPASAHHPSRPALAGAAEPHEFAPPAHTRAHETPAAPIAPPPMLPSERIAHGRAAEPAVASHIAKLESLLRRLLGSQLHRLDEIDEAPAGPGVFVISDSDLVTSYYVESCKTLRLGIGQLLRGQRGRSQGGGPFRANLAEHLEISESKVSDYLKRHCVVRWIQLDDDAPYFAHFVIGVLKSPLNAE